MNGQTYSLEDFLVKIADVELDGADVMQWLCNQRVDLPLSANLAVMDPFSSEYKETVLTIHRHLRGCSEDYIPSEHEKACFEEPANLFSDISPWDLKDTKYFSEFVFSWGQILKLLDLKQGSTVLEYGSGSGQMLLMLARLGIDVHAVDIDQRWLDLVRRQADVMGLSIALEKNVFGEGFEGKQFDRILFFEAFHHSIDFMELLVKIRSKLKPNGYIVFCGEPIMMEKNSSLPYLWGPRLDGASVYCIHKFGWMELGFVHRFFVEALQRAGYDLTYVPFQDCGRAVAYRAIPGTGKYDGPDLCERRRPTLLKRLRVGVLHQAFGSSRAAYGKL